MQRLIFFYCMLITSVANEVTVPELELRARIIRDVTNQCIHDLEDRLAELELLTVESTAPEKPYLILASYDRTLENAKDKVESIKAYNPSTSDLREFITSTTKVVADIGGLVRSLVRVFPGGLDTLNKHSDLLAYQRMWLVDIGVALLDLAMDMDALKTPRDINMELDMLFARLQRAFGQLTIFVEGARGIAKTDDAGTQLLFGQVDALCSQVSKRFATIDASAWQSMTTKKRREAIEFFHDFMRQAMRVSSSTMQSPASEIQVPTFLDLQDEHKKVMTTLNLVRERLELMTPKKQNHIEELIKYVEDNRKDTVSI